MVRLWKALPLTLALVALSIATSSCSSGGTAQMRVINAIPDASSALDVEFNTSKVNSSPIAFDSVYPPAATPANYFGVSTGADTIEVLLTGTTKNPIIESSSESLTGGDYYTVVLAGFVNSPAAAYLISDNNLGLTSGTVKYRVINASAASIAQYANGFDIYILPQGQVIHGIPQISGLTLGQAGPGYLTFNYAAEYTVWVTQNKSTLPLFSNTLTPNNPQITTLVIVDESTPNGFMVSPNMLTLIDQQ